MTTPSTPTGMDDVERRTRAAMAQLAGSVHPVPPPVDDLLARQAVPIAVPAARRLPWRAGLGVAAALAVLIAGVVVAVRAGDSGIPDGPSITTPTEPSVVTADTTAPATTTPIDGKPEPRVVAETLVAAGNARFVAAFGTMWMAGTDDRVVQSIEPDTMRVTSSLQLDGDVTSIVAGDDALYACAGGEALRIDPTTTAVTARSPVGCTAGDAAVGHGSVWVPTRGAVLRLDPVSLQVQSTIGIDADSRSPEGVAVGEGAVWITVGADPADATSGAVVRLDPETGETDRITTPGPARQALAAHGRIWVTLSPQAAHDLTGLVALDPATGAIDARVTRFPVEAGRIVDTGTALVVSSYFGPIAVVDPADGTVTTTFDPDPTAPAHSRSTVAWDGDRVWNVVPAAGGIGGRLLAIDLTPASPAPVPPAVAASVRAPADAAGLATSDGRTWRITADGTLAALDVDGGIVEQHEVPDGLTELAAGDGALFACGAGGSARIDLTPFAVVAGDAPCERGIAVGERAVWLAQGTTVAQLDPDSMATLEVIGVGSAHGGITTAAGAVWAADGTTFGTPGFVTRIDPAEPARTTRIPLPSAAHFVVEHDGRLWVSLWPDPSTPRAALAWIDPTTAEVGGTLDHLVLDAERLVAVGDRLAVSTLAGSIAIVDPGGSRLVGTWYHGDTTTQDDQSVIAWDGTHLWQHVPTSGAGPAATLAIDLGDLDDAPTATPTDERTLARIPVASGAADVAVGAGRVWVASTGIDELVGLDPGTGERTVASPIPAGSTTIAATDDAVFVCGPTGLQRLAIASLATTAADARPCDAIAVADAVWTLDGDAGFARRFDPGDLALTATVDVPTNGAAIAIDGSQVLVSGPDVDSDGGDDHGSVVVIDASTATMQTTIPVPLWVRSITVVDATTWVAGVQVSGGDPIGTALVRVGDGGPETIQVSIGMDVASVFGFGRNVGVRSAEGELTLLDPATGRGSRWSDGVARATVPWDLDALAAHPPAWDGTRLWNLVQTAGGTELVAIDPGPILASRSAAEPRAVAALEATNERAHLAFGFGKVWRAGTRDHSLVAIDPITADVITTVADVPGPYLTVGDESIFVCGVDGVVRVDPTTGDVLARTDRPCDVAIAAGAGSVWIAGDGGIVRLDAATLTEQAMIPDVVARWGITYAFGSVWVADGLGRDGADLAGHVTRIDPATNAVTAMIATPGRARLFAAADGGLWVTIGVRAAGETSLVRIDPATNAITARVPGSGATGIAVVGDLLATSSVAGPITLVDPATATVVETFDAHAAGPRTDRSSIVWDGSRLWQHLPNADYAVHGATLAIDLGRLTPS